MCKICNKKISDLYGISRDDVSFVGTAKMNLAGYFKDMPGAGKLSDREKVRILLLRLGVNFDATELERRGADYMAGKNA